MESQTGSGSMGKFMSKAKPYAAMISLQFGFAGMYVITSLCLKKGLSHYVLVVYRHVAAAIAIGPFAYFMERKVRPKMTLSIFIKIAILGFLEPVLDQNLYYVGMQYTSATFASAMYNVLPAITFILAIILRRETIQIKKIPSQAKVLGTVVTLGGAMLMTLYKGPVLDLVWSSGQTHHITGSSGGGGGHKFVKGTIMLFASCFSWAVFFIVQSFTLDSYPAELSLAALVCVMGIVEGGAVALVMERNAAAWSIGWDTRLLAPIYSGIVNSGLTYFMQGMVMKERGPVFVTAFNPLCMIIVAFLGSIILGDEISLGRVIGAVIIVVGLYAVVWGKSKDPIGSPESPSIDKKKGSSELPMTAMNSEKTNSSEDYTLNGVVTHEVPAKGANDVLPK
ncbi:WAT1-related protein At1g44800-like [Aristolochia californica]|uniref:WAT1-related protein At1g44800-like n=1 Tax=Aristolochia californica TaxID=171875 RepID=UPI0035DB8DF2